MGPPMTLMVLLAKVRGMFRNDFLRHIQSFTHTPFDTIITIFQSPSPDHFLTITLFPSLSLKKIRQYATGTDVSS